MKKIFTLIAGITFLATGLFTGCGKNAKLKSDTGNPGEIIETGDTSKRVKIYLSYIKLDGIDHLFIHDSHDNSNIDSLITDVKRGDTVIWKLDEHSGIKKIENVYLNRDSVNLIKNNPEILSGKNQFKLEILGDAQEGKQKYTIVFTQKHNVTDSIDPYIRVPPIK